MSKSILLSGLSIGIVALALNAAEPTDLAFQNADGSGDIASADA